MLAKCALRPLCILTVMIVLAAAGCGSKSEPKLKAVTPVKGKVTLGGNPLADAMVTLTFQGSPPAGYLGSGAKTDAQGSFEIMTGSQKGVPPGKYTVTVSKLVGADGKPLVNDPNSGIDPTMMALSGSTKELVPPVFNDPAQSQTILTVTEGTPVPDLTIAIP